MDVAIDGANGVLFNVSGGSDLAMAEINEAAKIITASIDPDAKVIFGAVQDETLKKGEIKITVVAAGFKSASRSERPAITTTFIFQRQTTYVDETKEHDIKPTPAPVTRPEPVKEVIDSSVQDRDEDDFDIPAFIRRKMK